jgi:hypothetical protein
MSRLFLALFVAIFVAACSGGNDSASPATSTPTTVVASPTATTVAGTTASPAPSSTSTPSAQASGVTGIALVGPACPVIRQDEPCPDRPWLGTVVVQTPAGAEVARTDTDAQGRFMLALTPGEYVILTLTTGILPAPASVDITVASGQVAEVELLLDSGIR